MRERKSGFTLIEMLVVIAIISILAAMMSPSLMKALGAARLVACTNNLKQVGTAMSIYAGDYVFYPAAWPRGEGVGMDYNQHWWYYRLLPYTGQDRAIKNWDDAAAVRTSGIFNCPEGGPELNNDNCHFSMNAFAALAKDCGFSPVALGVGVSSIDVNRDSVYVRPDSRCTKVPDARFFRAPSSKIVFVSELGYSYDAPDKRSPHIRVGGLNGYMDQVNPGTVVDGFKAAFRHNGRKNVLWFDLHAATIGRFETNYYLMLDPANN